MMIQVMMKSKQIVPYILAVVCATAFFAFEFAPDKTKAYQEAKANHLERKKARTLALSKVKEAAKDTEVYKLYLKEKKATNEAWLEYLEVRKKEKFLGFRSFQQFLGELGWVLGLFIYALFNLFRSYVEEKQNKGIIVLHGTLIIIACFYLYWIFQPFQDVNKISYYIMAVLTGLLVCSAVYLMAKYKFTQVHKLQLTIRNLFDFILVDTKEQALIKEEKQNYYNKKSLELVKNALDNEQG
ncbi:hypothetical protein [Tenacibaculum sp. 190524A02b]|uniref:hypothetical protein n=1 Tax=Tenacibaculum vairaonense TaxID=3137860 RepID=UPI0032B1E49D